MACRPEWTAAPGADPAARCCICMAAAMSSARSTVTATWRRRSPAISVAAPWRCTTGCRRSTRFPAPVEDALAGYRYLLALGIAPNHIALAGDSAGGGLVVAALVAIRDAGLAQPACGWCISPWVDMEGVGASMTGKAAEDPIVQKEPLLEMSAHYLNGADPRSPSGGADLRRPEAVSRRCTSRSARRKHCWTTRSGWPASPARPMSR